jgi:hypothetical protein
MAKPKHGHARCANGKKPTRAYRTWMAMRRRCHDKKFHKYPHYGAVGIQVCERWRNSFAAFLEDMGEPPVGHTIDRIDGTGDYSEENCRWADVFTQARNRRNNCLFTFGKETFCLAVWAEKLGIADPTIRNRLKRGWSAKDAFYKPVKRSSKTFCLN